MIEIIKSDITDIKEFKFLAWNKKKGEPYNQIKPLAKRKANEVWKFVLTLSPDNNPLELNGELFTKKTYREITLEQWNDEANEKEVSCWLQTLVPSGDLFLVYQPDCVVMVSAEVYSAHWQVFDWSPGMSACSADGKWFLSLYNDKFVIGGN